MIAVSASTVDIAAIFTDNGTISISGGTVDITTAILGVGNFTINNGTLELGAATAETMTFESGGGTLQLASPTSFSGEIVGIVGTDDVLDLKGYDASTTASTAGGYNASANTTTLTVADPGHSTLEFTLAGNISASSWTVSPDSNGTGVDIVDPPATSHSTDSQYPATTVNETTPVWIGGPGDDTFIFHPSIDAEAATKLNPGAATAEFDRSTEVQTNQQLMSLITSDPHGHAILELDHHGRRSDPDLTQNQLRLHLQSFAQFY